MNDVVHGNSEYSSDMTQKAWEFCLLVNANDEQLAEYLNISVRTLYRWKKEFPEFCQAVKEGKLGADIAAINAFFRRVTGYEYTEVKVEKFKNKAGEHVEKTVTTTKHIPPDIQAGQFWLTNRHPERWKVPANIEVNTSVDVSVNSPEELEAIYQQADEAARKKAEEQQLEGRGERIAMDIGK